MASAAVSVEVQDDEAWLYGDAAPEKKDLEESAAVETPTPGNGVEVAASTLSAAATPFQPGVDKKTEEDKEAGELPGIDKKTEEDKEAGELSGEEAENKTEEAVEEENEDDDDDEDDSDDDIQVTIGDIKTQTAYDAPMFKGGYGRGGAGSVAPKPQTKGIDLDAPGNINGVSVYEFEVSSLKDDEKPWQKPGADITDYFNYGFNEETWARYGEKQRRLRTDNSGKTYTPQPKPSKSRMENTIEMTDQSPGGAAGRRAGPPPFRKMAGSIDVIGGSTADSRRPQQDFQDHLPSSEALDYKKYPPPGMPGPIMTHLPPPVYAVPPPGTMPPPPNPLPPPMVPPPPQGIAPPGISGPPPNFAPPPAFFPPGPGAPPMTRVGPPPFGDRPPFSYETFGPPPPAFRAPPTGPPPNWEARPDNFNRSWEFNREQRTPPRSDSDFSSSDDDADVRSNFSYSSRQSVREGRDNRDSRARDTRSGRDIRDGRDSRDGRESRDGHERYDPFERSSFPRRSMSRDRGPESRDRESRDRPQRDREVRESRDREIRSSTRDREMRSSTRDREIRSSTRDRDIRGSTRDREIREPRDRESHDREPRESRDRELKRPGLEDRHDDRHKSRSRRHHEAEDHHSKHRKSKRAKHDHETEPPATETPPVTPAEQTVAS